MEEIDPVLQKRQDNAKRFDGLALLQPDAGVGWLRRSWTGNGRLENWSRGGRLFSVAGLVEEGIDCEGFSHGHLVGTNRALGLRHGRYGDWWNYV